MVLRFDDAALATLIRVLRAVPPEERSNLLQKLAAKHDPSRQLKRYYRRKRGRMSLHLELDPEGVADCLRSVGVSVWEIDKPTLKAAIEAFFEGWEVGAFRLVHGDEE
jgi:hypothetical protein